MFAETIGVDKTTSRDAAITASFPWRFVFAATLLGWAMNASSARGQIMLPAQDQAAPQLNSVAYALGGPDVSGQVDALHSPHVDQMLAPQFKLSLERRHSQLVITAKRVRRIAVTDSTIVNYVQYSPTELALVGLELGTTDLTLWFDGEVKPSIFEVSVVRDQSLEDQRRIDFGRLERRLVDLFPNSNVYLIPVGAQVIVKGLAFDPEEATQIMQIVRSEVIRSNGNVANQFNQAGLGNGLNGGGGIGGVNNQNQFGRSNFNDIVINMLEIPGEYNVKMRVIIAEVSRSQLRSAGVDWNVLLNDGAHTLAGGVGGASGTTLSGIFENGEITVLINWLAGNGTATLLAEPTIVCMSGHSASLLAGGEFAVPTIIGLGGGQATSFRGVGTSMIVTPTVIKRDLIRLQIVPEYSALDGTTGAGGVPGTSVKRLQTTVELREGQTLALGGLISRQASTEANRIPLLGDLPLVGKYLFHSKRASEDETELLVLVSPEIVRPMEPDEVPPLPNYYITHPNDHDVFKYARTEGNPDLNIYQTQPFGSGQTQGIPQGYSLFNPPVTGPGFQPSGQPAYSNSMQYGTNFPHNMQILEPHPEGPLPPPAPGAGVPQRFQGTPQTVPQHPSPQYQPPMNASPQTVPPVPQGQALPPIPSQYQSLNHQQPGFFSRMLTGQSRPAAQQTRTAGWQNSAQR